jgi:glycosyltransferase involved in cell wall biosynthesis
MRIGFVIYGSLDTLTGGYLYDQIVVQGLKRFGHEVKVISLPSGCYFRRLMYGFVPGASRSMLKEKFDIVIQDELCHPSLFRMNKQILRQDFRPILVALVHHILCDEPRHRWHNMLLAVAERSFLASVDGFICNSETTRRKVRSLVDHNRPELIAYPAGDRLGSPLSGQVIRKRAQRPGPLKLCFLGNVIPRKGLLPLLRALDKVDRKIWHLSVVGGLDLEPAHTAEVRQLSAQLDLSDSVRFLGPLQDAELIEVLSTSHLFCMPYAYEGFGIAILEAMAFGLPAIGCQNGAAGETIRHGENGFLLAPDDLAGLGPLLIKLHKNREDLQRLALAACATYARSPRWQDSVAAIDGFLREMKKLQDQRENTGLSRNLKTSRQEDFDATQ